MSSLSLSRTGSLYYASLCVARAHSYASGVKILFVIFLAYFLGNTRHKRERDEANTKKKPRVASVREWQTGKLLLFRPPIEEGERKTPEKTKHTCRDSISFFFAFGNPGYTFRVF